MEFGREPLVVKRRPSLLKPLGRGKCVYQAEGNHTILSDVRLP